jgi:hypothetical protein
MDERLSGKYNFGSSLACKTTPDGNGVRFQPVDMNCSMSGLAFGQELAALRQLPMEG